MAGAVTKGQSVAKVEWSFAKARATGDAGAVEAVASSTLWDTSDNAAAAYVNAGYSVEVTVANSGTLNLALDAGTLKDIAGDGIVFTKLKEIVVYIVSGGVSGTVDLTQSAGTSMGLLGGTTPAKKVAPAGVFLDRRPTAAGYAVTSGAVLTLTNNSGAGAVVRVGLLGVQ